MTATVRNTLRASLEQLPCEFGLKYYVRKLATEVEADVSAPRV